MDEPYGQLDIDLRFKLEDELIKLWKKTGTTVLFITHNIGGSCIPQPEDYGADQQANLG